MEEETRRFLAMDDETAALTGLLDAIEEAAPKSDVRGFLHQEEGISAVRNGFSPDVAFLDIDMPGKSGLEVAKEIRELSQKTKIVFVTACQEYSLDAFAIHARGYVLKPATARKIRSELDEIYPAQAEEKKKYRIRVQCFGNFEIFADEKPLVFHFSKSKEILAYLVDRRGAMVNNSQIIACVWENQAETLSVRSHLRTAIADIRKSLQGVGADDVLIKGWNTTAVNVSRIDCDYYRFLKGDTSGINAYKGEYMSQYSWAEMTLGTLASARK